MREKQKNEYVCRHCGYDERKYKLRPYVLPPFTILNGKYLLGKVLGSGGFGITYIALDLSLERVLAIKEYFMQGSMYRNTSETTVVTTTGSSQEVDKIFRSNLEKFESEAKTLAGLDDLPGIVRVYDFFKENNTLYMVLEYLSGKTLEQYVLEQGGRLSWEEVTERLSPAMQSLQRLHEKRILHRDISPDNMMVLDTPGHKGEIKLFDFGGARTPGKDKKSSVALKKYGYSPIEQTATTEQQGPWTDVYAMAATIYYCICGEAPLDSVERITTPDRFVPPSLHGAKITSRQEAALLKGLAIRPAERFASMEAFRSALFGNGNVAQSEEHNHTARTVLAVLLVLGLLGGGITWYLTTKNRPVKEGQTSETGMTEQGGKTGQEDSEEQVTETGKPAGDSEEEAAKAGTEDDEMSEETDAADDEMKGDAVLSDTQLQSGGKQTEPASEKTDRTDDTETDSTETNPSEAIEKETSAQVYEKDLPAVRKYVEDILESRKNSVGSGKKEQIPLEDYENLSVYTLHTGSTYVIYACYDEKLYGIETLYPCTEFLTSERTTLKPESDTEKGTEQITDIEQILDAEQQRQQQAVDKDPLLAQLHAFENSGKTETVLGTGSNVNLRSRPDTSGAQLASLQQWTQLERILTLDNHWALVLYQDTYGYCAGNYLVVKGSEEEAAKRKELEEASQAQSGTDTGYTGQWTDYTYDYSYTTPTGGENPGSGGQNDDNGGFTGWVEVN